MANRNVKGKSKQFGKSCSKLKKRHPQGLKRTCNMHPQNLGTLLKQEQEEQVKE